MSRWDEGVRLKKHPPHTSALPQPQSEQSLYSFTFKKKKKKELETYRFTLVKVLRPQVKEYFRH